MKIISSRSNGNKLPIIYHELNFTSIGSELIFYEQQSIFTFLNICRYLYLSNSTSYSNLNEIHLHQWKICDSHLKNASRVSNYVIIYVFFTVNKKILKRINMIIFWLTMPNKIKSSMFTMFFSTFYIYFVCHCEVKFGTSQTIIYNLKESNQLCI